MFVTLEDCPTGIFKHTHAEYGVTYGFKSEYSTEVRHPETKEFIAISRDAYCIPTGEYFWGGAKDHSERSKLLVEPCDLDEESGQIVIIPDTYFENDEDEQGWKVDLKDGVKFAILGTWF